MFSKYLIPAVAIIGSAAAASSTASICSVSTATVDSAAAATSLSSCTTYSGSILISADAPATLELTGITEITGDLILENNGAITSFSSDSITTISGSFTLTNLTALSNLEFSALTTVGEIDWTALTAISELNFGDVGITSATTVTISDTFLSSLDGIDLETAETVNINNNGRLTTWDSKLTNLSDLLNIQANGQDLSISLPNLVWIANMTISNVTTFEVPALQVVNGSATFDSNYFTSFAAPNMTKTASGDLSFIDNADLKNLSLPILAEVGGGLLIANNTELDDIDLPKLTTVLGAVKLMGNFSSIELPDLDDVRGAFDVSSTTDISSDCSTFEKLDSKTGNGDIQGTFSCTSNNADADDNTSGSTTNDTTSGGTTSSTDSGAAGTSINIVALGLGLVAGIVALL